MCMCVVILHRRFYTESEDVGKIWEEFIKWIKAFMRGVTGLHIHRLKILKSAAAHMKRFVIKV